MSIADIFSKIFVPFCAAIIGSILTFWYQRKIQKKAHKVYIISTLMAYRYAGTFEDEFVKALNMVDIVFHDNKKVKELLHKYLEYTSNSIYSGGHRVAVFFEMILAMAQDIGYNELTHADIKEFYVPLRKDILTPAETASPAET